MSEFSGGRRVAIDERDKQYGMRRQLDPLREQFFPRGFPSGTRHYRQGPVLDQGKTGTCVAHGWSAWAYGAPLMTSVSSLPTPYELYRKIVLVDPWADNDFEATVSDDQLQAGSSVRAGVQVYRAMGIVKNFLWAQSVEDIRAWHLAGLGGVVLGVNWTANMMKPDVSQVIHYTGDIEGGHCIKTTGWTDTFLYNGQPQSAVRIINSWGRVWGELGRAWILSSDLEKMLTDGGEFCAATEQKVT